MSTKKNNTFDREEYEKLMKKLAPAPRSPREPEEDPSYFNPWNMSKKKQSVKRVIFAALPEDLPE